MDALSSMSARARCTKMYGFICKHREASPAAAAVQKKNERKMKKKDEKYLAFHFICVCIFLFYISFARNSSTEMEAKQRERLA